ncbi:hypothetical protein [Pseudotamlana carrageenivorans]|uniref:Late control protein n=1 Tax=Pseudotamlana carrageenivorans TaxID=2069432 RepID=A0A2I7SF04_9FLAO|nr:hypothetical protein [Tamlana carrageenivorans]AUS04482.1 hypothetical protein C1A40_02895 [Tamlana carrageenivorans]
MLNIDWYIEFKNSEGKRFQLALLAECEIISSVENLADTATIVLPEAVMNDPLNFENKIGRGTEVLIKMGYDNQLETEFTGFIKEILNTDSALKIICEDALFVFRVGVPDVELKETSVSKIAQYVISQIDANYTVNCSFDINYEKFTIHDATGYEVLKKIQEDTSAAIYFDSVNKVLHIHEPYIYKGGEAIYSMQHNIESSSLEYKNKLDYKVEVTVESTDVKGNVHKTVIGTTGGEKVVKQTGVLGSEAAEKLAQAILKTQQAPMYEGSFDTWLVPMCKPTYSARIKDEDYPDKTAWYYVKSVTTTLSESGGKRTITPGIKLN